MTREPKSKTEIIAFSSGKGGTGKTSLASALGYALIESGHNVLLVDADYATDGFSLFLLGPKGMFQIGDFGPLNTFTGFLQAVQLGGSATVEPRTIHRVGSDDHGVSYKAVISGKGIYGAIPETAPAVPSTKPNSEGMGYSLPASVPTELIVPVTKREVFQQAIRALYGQIRESGQYDYVLVDTRGGFSFESTDVCAAADSFVVVTEASVTSFYQDRNLIDRINQAAAQLTQKPLLRAIIVNKATEGAEEKFRAALANEFGLRLQDTFAVALDLDAVRVYKTQQIIYRRAPASPFAFDTLNAFSDILRIVTVQWPEDRVKRWNEIVERVKFAIREHNRDEEEKEKRLREQGELFRSLQEENQRLRTTVDANQKALDQSRKDADELITTIKAQLERERAAAEQHARERQAEVERLERFYADRTQALDTRAALPRERALTALWVASVFLAVLLLAAVGFGIPLYIRGERRNQELEQALGAMARNVQELQTQLTRAQEELYRSKGLQPSPTPR